MAYSTEELFTITPAYTNEYIEAFYNEFLEEWLAMHRSDDDLVLFHYTNPTGLKGILESRALWYNHTAPLNDPSEVKYGISVIKSTVKSLIEKADNSEDKLKFLQHINNSVTLGNLHHAYIACFCESGKLLSQWREYSNKGGGYNIGFTFNNDTHVNGIQGDVYSSSKLKLRKVIYDRKTQEILVEKVVTGLFESVLKSKEKLNDADFDYVLSVTGLTSSNILSDLVISFKHEAFSEEQEWRAVRFILDTHEVEHLKFRTSSKYLIPYRVTEIYRQNDEEVYYFPISTINLGPSSEKEVAKTGVEFLLNNLRALDNHHIKIPDNVEVLGSDFKLRED
jgi:hypothetical protein